MSAYPLLGDPYIPSIPDQHPHTCSHAQVPTGYIPKTRLLKSRQCQGSTFVPESIW
jgi:hypothetical protein